MRAGAAEALRCQKYRVRRIDGQDWSATGEMVTLPARTILVAAGTQPNTVLAREDEHNVTLDGRYFQAVDEDGATGQAGAHRQAQHASTC